MRKCIEICKRKEYECIKTNICGTCETRCCGEKIMIFDGRTFCKSYGTVKFSNVGDCPVEIYKNKLSSPIAVVSPGSNYTLTAKPLYRIAVKCVHTCKSSCFIMLCYEGCVCSLINQCRECECHHTWSYCPDDWWQGGSCCSDKGCCDCSCCKDDCWHSEDEHFC